MSIQIMDVHPGGKFDIEYELNTGMDGVILKAGQGHLEYKWKDRAALCEAKGLPWGVYWLVDARYNPEGHKRAIKAAFPAGDFGPLGLWLDVEKPVWTMPDIVYRRLPFAYYKTVESVAQGVIAYSGKKPGIYTSPGMFNLCFGIVPLDKLAWFATLPLWSAQYKVKKPSLYGAWTRILLWQYQENPDYSVFDGTEKEFRSHFSMANQVNQQSADYTAGYLHACVETLEFILTSKGKAEKWVN
jgi:GH25 family lysozyme M1 (1,4-beta-N-acetylmuramidase)